MMFKWINRWIEKVRVALQWKDYEIDGTAIDADKRFFIVQADSAHMAVEKEIVPTLGELLPSNKRLRLVKIEATPTLGNIWTVAAIYEAENPTRIDSAGRDVTDLPGLWDETDRFENELLEFVRDVSLDPWPDSDLASLLKTLQTRARHLLEKAGEQ